MTLGEKVDRSVKRIQFTWSSFNDKPGAFAYLAYSGGKDSTVILELTKMAGIPFQAVYNVTTVDPPELVQHIKRQKEVHMHIGRYADGSPVSMWNLIVNHKTPPTRVVRYCCEALKEYGGKGQLCITGVRWAESKRRADSWGTLSFTGARAKKKADELSISYDDKGRGRFSVEPVPVDEFDPLEDMIDGYYSPDEKTIMLNSDNDALRRLTEYCVPKSKTVLNPIIDWTDDDVWNFIFENNLTVCELYKNAGKGGCKSRLGCIGCPMVSSKKNDLEEYPKYKEMYLRTFDKMLKARADAGMETKMWHTADEVMSWWVEDDPGYKSYANGATMFDYDITSPDTSEP